MNLEEDLTIQTFIHFKKIFLPPMLTRIFLGHTGQPELECQEAGSGAEAELRADLEVHAEQARLLLHHPQLGHVLYMLMEPIPLGDVPL